MIVGKWWAQKDLNGSGRRLRPVDYESRGQRRGSLVSGSTPEGFASHLQQPTGQRNPVEVVKAIW